MTNTPENMTDFLRKIISPNGVQMVTRVLDGKANMGDADESLKELLLAILSAYEARGESELATKKLGTFLIARYGSVNEGKAELGGLATIRQAFRTMQASLYFK